MRPCATGGSGRRRSRCSTPTQTRSARGGHAPLRSVSSACARRATAIATRARFRGSRRARRSAGVTVPCSERVQLLPADRRGVTGPRRRVRERSGWDESLRPARVERVRAVDGGFDLDGHGRFRHVLLAPGHPGLAAAPELASHPHVIHAYEPHEYADARHGRRCRDGRSDGVAERTRCRCGGGLGAQARAGQEAAQHPADALLAPRPRRLPRHRAAASGALLRSSARPPTRPAETGTSRWSARLVRDASGSRRRSAPSR